MAADAGIVLVLLVSLFVFTLAFALYAFVLRPSFPEVYYPKKRHDPLYASRFEWIWDVIQTTEEQVVESGGFLALMYLRFQMYALVLIFILCILSLCLLLPIYAGIDVVGAGLELNDSPHPLFVASTAMVLREGSRWLWLPTVGVVITSALSYLFLLAFLRMFLHTRRDFRFRDHDGVNYHSVKLQNLPRSMYSPHELMFVLNEWYGEGEVVAVHIVSDLSAIERLQRKKAKALRQLDRAEYRRERDGERPKHTLGWCCSGEEVDSITHWRERVLHYSHAITHLQEHQKAHHDAACLRTAFVSFRSAATAYAFVHQQTLVVFPDTLASLSERATEMRSIGVKATIRQIAEEAQQRLMPWVGRKKGRVTRDDSMMEGAGESLMAAEGGGHGLGRELDMVVVQKLRMKNMHWNRTPAVKPKDVIWANLGYSGRSHLWRTTLTTILVLMIAFFWAIPVSILTSISLLAVDNFFGSVLSSLVSDYLPTLLLMAGDALMPFIIRYITLFEKRPSTSSSELSTLNKFILFVLLNHLLFPSLIMGGLQAIVNNTINDSEDIDFSISGSFFVVYLIEYSFIGMAAHILRSGDFVKTNFRRLFAVTPREYEEAEQLTPFYFWEYFADSLMGFAIPITFAIVVPLVAPASLLYMTMRFVVDKTHIVVTQPSNPNVDGRMITWLMYWMLACIFIAQWLFHIFLILKGASGMMLLVVTSLMLLSLLMAFVITTMIRKDRAKMVFECATSERMMSAFSVLAADAEDVLTAAYTHPAMQQEPEDPLSPAHRFTSPSR